MYNRARVAILAIAWLVSLSDIAIAEDKTELGTINGAQFRIDIPPKWEGKLVMYAHGYSTTPTTFSPAPNPLARFLLDHGYAVAQSGYASGGWAIPEAMNDTEALRRYFIKTNGPPKEVFIVGHSLGGFVVLMTIEQFPGSYKGGLALCAPLAPADWFLGRRAFDVRAVFDYYFPAVFPMLNQFAASYVADAREIAKVLAVLNGAPEKADVVRRFADVRNNSELASDLVLLTHIINDLENRSGGNPFDNTAVLYHGTPIDDRLNQEIRRYKADKQAEKYLQAFYTPTGRLAAPLLSITTTYDPLIPAWVSNSFGSLVARAGNSDMFAQRFVKGEQHCAIPYDAIEDGLSKLEHWAQ